MKQEHENNVTIYSNRATYLLQKISSIQSDQEKAEIYEEVIEVCKAGVKTIDQAELFKFYGEKHHDSSTDELKK